MDKNKTKGIICSIAMAIIWGFSFLSIKISVVAIPPMSLGLVRFIIASLVLAAFYLFSKKKPHLKKEDSVLMIGSALIGTTIYFIGENNGVLLLSASEASILVGAIPVLAVIVDRIFLKTKLTFMQYFGAVISVLGIGIMVAESLKITPSPLGYFYMILAAICWVSYAFMTKPLLKKYDSLEITFWQSVFGAIGFIPFAMFETVNWQAINGSVVLNILYLGVFCSAIGYLLYIAGLNLLGAGVSSIFLNLIPVVTVIASFIILKESLTPFQTIGGIVTILGVYLTSIFAPKKKQN